MTCEWPVCDLECLRCSNENWIRHSRTKRAAPEAFIDGSDGNDRHSLPSSAIVMGSRPRASFVDLSHEIADGMITYPGLPGVIVDAPNQAVGPEAFAKADTAGKAVLVRTGWDQHWGTERYGSTDHPFITGEAARHLVDSGAHLVGIDSLNVDDTSPATRGVRPTHTLLLAGGVLIVEHLCNLAALGTDEFTFYAVPPRVRGMLSFPVRAFAELG